MLALNVAHACSHLLAYLPHYPYRSTYYSLACGPSRHWKSVICRMMGWSARTLLTASVKRTKGDRIVPANRDSPGTRCALRNHDSTRSTDSNKIIKNVMTSRLTIRPIRIANTKYNTFTLECKTYMKTCAHRVIAANLWHCRTERCYVKLIFCICRG